MLACTYPGFAAPLLGPYWWGVGSPPAVPVTSVSSAFCLHGCCLICTGPQQSFCFSGSTNFALFLHVL